MEIYLHTSESDEPKLVEVKSDQRIAEIADEAGADVWLEDAEQPLAASSTFNEAGITERSHVHVSTCKRIAVAVRYGGDSKTHEFPPGATIASVFAWAAGKRGFDLPAAQRAKHTLGICGTLTQPDKSAQVGSFASTDCSACFDLAPKERFEG